MKKSFTALLAVTALGLAACGGVDRDGTRDIYIDGIESAGFTADSDCVDNVLGNYSDDELKSFDKPENEGTPEFEAWAAELATCIDFGG
jgi:hypothetical protein